ncbi:serine/threonine protein kinase [Corallococcus macrosporus]|uniref:Serine/threonine protein kinase n=1 Tax=Corallococcus macrosporus TaxID=35 RepID=A0ABS3D485_9BACT|nr:serine/threonine-protein kinase [Corallococcus macrosporus]MBN8225900.1 serine/threonine protein kinase [Corallococcus macrosporus]
MAIDEERIRQFIAERPMRSAIAAIVRRAGFIIAWVESNVPERWGFYLKLNSNLKELFGTNREVLLWVVEHREFQARTVSQAAEIIERERPRLCEDFALIFATDRNTANHVAETSDRMMTAMIGISTEEIPWLTPHGNLDFVRWIQKQLFSKDLYYISTAITSPNAFYGRRSLITEVVEQLKRGSAHIGLFGLRKMGKTSFLFRVAAALQQSQDVFWAHTDIQRLDAINPTAEYFLWSLGEALLDANSQLRRLKGFRLFGRHEVFVDIEKTSSVWEYFDHDIRLILRETKKKIVFLLDEVELMSPTTPGSHWGNAFVRSWRLLRGLEQQNAGRISYFITGTNPQCIETNLLDGLENPAYNYFSKRYLSQLTTEECADLLVNIGSRMGLNWSNEAQERLIRSVGGHPFLLRAYASRVHKALLPRIESRKVTPEIVSAQLEAFIADVNSTLSQMIEVLADQYHSEYYLFETLAIGNIGEFQELSQAFPDDIAHLRGYGLVDSDPNSASISIEVLQTWMQRRNRIRRLAPMLHDAGSPQPGDEIEGYKIIAALGRPGGFAQVFQAQKGNKDSVALKIFKSASLAVLQREVDALSYISHKNIVKILDHGKTPSGLVYLVMEHLAGKTLLACCERSARLAPSVAIEVTKELLGALIELHPNERDLDELRQKTSLDAQEFERFNKARHGYIHRDIKPENVMLVPGRGAVLIDFNISTRVGTPVKTVSSTPGYLPPDGLSNDWTPSVDLFQLGLTMLQATVGHQYNGDNLADLRAICAKDVPNPLRDVLLRMTADVAGGRFSSAYAALVALGSGSTPLA